MRITSGSKIMARASAVRCFHRSDKIFYLLQIGLLQDLEVPSLPVFVFLFLFHLCREVLSPVLHFPELSFVDTQYNSEKVIAIPRSSGGRLLTNLSPIHISPFFTSSRPAIMRITALFPNSRMGQSILQILRLQSGNLNPLLPHIHSEMRDLHVLMSDLPSDQPLSLSSPDYCNSGFLSIITFLQ